MEKIFGIIDSAVSSVQAIHCPNIVDNPQTSKVFQTDSKNDKLCRILNDIREHFEEMGLHGGYLSALFHIDQINSLKNSAAQEVWLVFIN